MEKVAVVTGSAKGLGKSIALTLADRGYTLVIHYRKSRSEAQEVLGKIKKRSPRSILVNADLSWKSEVKKMFAKIFAKLKRVDLLVNNVGGFLYKKIDP